MNNATLALNVAAPASTAPAASSNDTSSSAHGFDAAMATARADAGRSTSPPPPPKPKAGASSTPPDDTSANGVASTTPAQAKAPATTDDDATRHDDDGKDDPSATDATLASAVLALIGVAPKTPTAPSTTPADALGHAAGAAVGATATSLGDLPPLGTDAAATGAKDGFLASLGLHATTDATAVAPPNVFTSLLAAQATDAIRDKADTRSATDLMQGSPMPPLHLSSTNVAAVPQWQATQPATSPHFAQELGEQIAWMGAGQIKEAQIKLHPEELGSMDVRVNLDGGKVNVAIMAQHPAAVHAVQQTLSQLDAMLAHHGLELGQADVGQRQAGQGGDGGASSARGEAAGSADAAPTASVVATSPVSRGLLDEVA
ncbi:flagellar hook-length control protein FliK [Luteibacter sp. PPL201]|uniref:Flagellar hook-length control protein FliK n=1 Tax=Luteibacter sahnii TaxID=3021977 RepID=A0ABT6BAK2_9GAMM|nr:flagellar hook-length control protein FliK [Luteibacter sp. PPL193]MDY1547131.1 flagellar hook-length control protein FliK [Luteibacter sp. PPL193]